MGLLSSRSFEHFLIRLLVKAILDPGIVPGYRPSNVVCVCLDIRTLVIVLHHNHALPILILSLLKPFNETPVLE